MDVSRFTDMRASDCELAVCDLHNLFRDSNVGTWVKRWVHFGGCGVSLWRCSSFKIDCPVVRYYKVVENEKYLYTLVKRFDG